MAKIPKNMPPWFGQHVTCPHCKIFLMAFTPRHPERWQDELAAITAKAGERCYCRKSYDELRSLTEAPAGFGEPSMYRVWLSQAINYRRNVYGEGKREEQEPTLDEVPKWARERKTKRRT